MKSNGLLKWLMIPLVLLAVFVGFKLFSSSKHSAKAMANDVGARLTPAEMKALGVEGDTPRDTLATLVAQLKQLRQELQAAIADNTRQKAENDRLREREKNLDQRIQTAFDTQRETLEKARSEATAEREQSQSLAQELQRKLDDLKKTGSHADLPVGLGLEDGDEPTPNTSDTRLKWFEPSDTLPRNGKSVSTPRVQHTAFELPVDQDKNPVDESAKSAETSTAKTIESALKPVYTVPANATLMGSVAMTALIGRVPIDGTVHDAFPFKVLIGADNLTANGIEVPGVAGAVASGTASGDWTLYCVRGQIRSITFVFNDGTVRTISSSHDAANSQGGLGWISDSYGNPCVTGERRSNAEQYLSSQMLLTAAGAGAASLIRSDQANTTLFTGTNGNALGTVGISGSDAMGRILAGGVQDMSQWVNKLYGQAFAAIYVKPGAHIAVHIDQALDIDYDAKGRKVDAHQGGSRELDLD